MIFFSFFFLVLVGNENAFLGQVNAFLGQVNAFQLRFGQVFMVRLGQFYLFLFKCIFRLGECILAQVWLGQDGQVRTVLSFHCLEMLNITKITQQKNITSIVFSTLVTFTPQYFMLLYALPTITNQYVRRKKTKINTTRF